MNLGEEAAAGVADPRVASGPLEENRRHFTLPNISVDYPSAQRHNGKKKYKNTVLSTGKIQQHTWDFKLTAGCVHAPPLTQNNGMLYFPRQNH
jgi:hypothetical protein